MIAVVAVDLAAAWFTRFTIASGISSENKHKSAPIKLH